MDIEFLKTEIRRIAKEKNAIIMAHYYTDGAIQDIADFVGDSLALAQYAAKTDADIIVMCGVNFMGETCKILCPEKKVLVLDTEAGCSLADSCKAEDLKKFKEEHPGYKVVTYVNTTAAVKALSDVVVTSSNASKVVNSFAKDEKLIFGPDKNLGAYINETSGRNMLLWNGGCHVHARFNADDIKHLKTQYPEAKVLVHPECPLEIRELADEINSTVGLINYSIKSSSKEFIVATECGVLYKMRAASPDKKFIYAASENVCEYMKLNTIEKLYSALVNETPEIIVDSELAEEAVRPINKMLSLS